jgi:hypothetical protein
MDRRGAQDADPPARGRRIAWRQPVWLVAYARSLLLWRWAALLVAGVLLGGIGISGGSVEEDIAIATQTLARFSRERFLLTPFNESLKNGYRQGSSCRQHHWFWLLTVVHLPSSFPSSRAIRRPRCSPGWPKSWGYVTPASRLTMRKGRRPADG